LREKLRAAPGKTVVLILDSIEDPQNLGSLIRTAEACGVQGVILPKERAVGITPAVVKASAGATFHLPVVRVTNLVSTLEELKKEGFWIVGADPGGDQNLYGMKFDMNVGLVIGSEGKGIRPLVLKKCDFRITIPMKGKVSSLNAAIAGAVVLFEILRQQYFSARPPLEEKRMSLTETAERTEKEANNKN
jgi:23S rRNA (guanosine2251-2'-O)-methyltransferase